MPERQATILKGSALFQETNVGAHYYAFSPTISTSKYTEAFANILLPPPSDSTKLNIYPRVPTQYSRRHAFISLGIGKTGYGDGVDLGIIYNGSGWMPCYHDTTNGNYSKVFTECVAPTTATNAIIVVKKIDSTRVGLYVQFLNSSGSQVAVFNRQDIAVASRDWSTARYYRFASLVQNPETAPDILTDSTYMVGGKFTNLGLYNQTTGSYDAWGTNTSLISDAWIMSHPKCQVTTTNNSDSFTIDHWA